MQDIHAIGGSASAIAGASIFLAGSSSGGGDRRLRPHNNQNNQLLKCPRCDSSNTKFCYYNNYNLSQPRHFCKNCRRYWTKGGVLRNVPVGGGCRKAKRSSSSKTKQTTSSSLEAVVVAVKEGDSNSHSSSDSSSLTATATTVGANTVTATATGDAVTVFSSNSPTNLLSFHQSKLFMPQINQNQPSVMSHMVSSSGQIFPEAGSFTSLMTSPPGESSLLGFNFADVSAYNQMQQNQTAHIEDEELKMDHSTINNYGYSDQTAQIGYSSLQQNRVTIGGLADLNWQFDGVGGEEEAGEDQGLFDFSGSDDQAYLVQNHWSDNDPSLNFPPLV